MRSLIYVNVKYLHFPLCQWKRGTDFMFQRSGFKNLKELERILIFFHIKVKTPCPPFLKNPLFSPKLFSMLHYVITLVLFDCGAFSTTPFSSWFFDPLGVSDIFMYNDLNRSLHNSKLSGKSGSNFLLCGSDMSSIWSL